ncbi:hypothetical protein M2271_006675 [Streptomyces sp. LBL]|nr:hypothetical protein [Streptomyces sp. LBL]
MTSSVSYPSLTSFDLALRRVFAGMVGEFRLPSPRVTVRRFDACLTLVLTSRHCRSDRSRTSAGRPTLCRRGCGCVCRQKWLSGRAGRASQRQRRTRRSARRVSGGRGGQGHAARAAGSTRPVREAVHRAHADGVRARVGDPGCPRIPGVRGRGVVAAVPYVPARAGVDARRRTGDAVRPVGGLVAPSPGAAAWGIGACPEARKAAEKRLHATVAGPRGGRTRRCPATWWRR